VVQQAPPGLGGFMPATATFSADKARTYRYVLTRTWDPQGPVVGWLMLNPSKADALANDQTISRCVSFSRGWGAGGLVVVNLFALRSTNPAGVRTHPDPVGVGNDEVIVEQLAAPAVKRVVAAWGAHPFAVHRARHVTELLAARDVALSCLGTAKGGYPYHPCRLPYRMPLADYFMAKPRGQR
jgi:hypothetical protein